MKAQDCLYLRRILHLPLECEGDVTHKKAKRGTIAQLNAPVGTVTVQVRFDKDAEKVERWEDAKCTSVPISELFPL